MNDQTAKVFRRASTQDVSWFIDCSTIGQLDLSPSYQRKSVWTSRDRKFFLDTVFRGFPCPAIYLHKTLADGKSVYAVVDGKQRLETIILFYKNKIALPQTFGDTRLDGKKWKDICKDQELAEKFMNYVFPVEFINLPFENSAYVNDVFDRLNRNAKLLNPQELRHAKFDGWFISFADEEVCNQFWRDCKISTNSRNKRMLDVQFISELLICLIKGEIIGFDQEIIDACYSLYDNLDDFDEENEWNLPEIDPDEIKQKFSKIRDDIKEMVCEDAAFLQCLKDNKTFYSIWSYLVIQENDSNLPKFSSQKFLKLYSEANNLGNIDKDMEDIAEENSSFVKYNIANRGATTELPQRIARFEAMKSFFEE